MTSRRNFVLAQKSAKKTMLRSGTFWAQSLNISKEFPLFDGGCAHEEQYFLGKDFSIVFCSVEGYLGAPEELQELLSQCGFHWPSAAHD